MKITLPPCSLMYRKYKKNRDITVFTLLSALEENAADFCCPGQSTVQSSRLSFAHIYGYTEMTELRNLKTLHILKNSTLTLMAVIKLAI